MPTATKNDNTREATKIVAFRCPHDLKRSLYVRKAQDESTIEEICVAALRMYLGRKSVAA